MSTSLVAINLDEYSTTSATLHLEQFRPNACYWTINTWQHAGWPVPVHCSSKIWVNWIT